MGLTLLNSDGSSFLIIGITLAIFSLSWNMAVFITFINRVNDLMMADSIIFNSFEEIPSKPQLFFVGRLSMVFFAVSLSTFLNLKTESTCFFKVITIILTNITLNLLCNSLTYICKIVIELIGNITCICYINAIFFKIKYFVCFIFRKNVIYDFPSISNVIFGTVKA